MNHPMVTKKDVERALRGEKRTPKFEVHYFDRSDPVIYTQIGQINFDKVRKVVLVFPEWSGTQVYLGDGDWVTRDRKKVRP
jgi:hypothetical protein